jgi:hypothetical protein
MTRIQRAALVLLATAIAAQGACRDLNSVSHAGQSTGGQTSGAGGEPELSAGAGNGGLGGESAEAGRAGSEDGSAGSCPHAPNSAHCPEVPGNAGSAGSDVLPDVQEVIAPGCIAGSTAGNDVPLATPRSLTASLGPTGLPYLLYTADSQSNMVTLRWKYASDDDAGWSTWQCLDTVVRPEQVSAITIEDRPTPDNTPEVYATNSVGNLFVRRFFIGMWATWETMGLPRANSHVIDVAASSTPDTLPFVYVIDSGRIFTRHHRSAQAYSSYAPWREVRDAPADAVHLCAGVQADHRQQLFVSTKNGNVFQAIQTSSTPEAGFGAFQPVVQGSTHAMSDIDCGYLADGTLIVVGLSAGKVWSHSSTTPSSLDWKQEPSDPTLTFTIFALGSGKNRTPTVFGIDAANVVWWHLLGTSSWTPT